MFGGEHRCGVQIALDAIPGAQGTSGLEIGGAGRQEPGELHEELLEPGRRDDLQDARRRVGGVPEGVPHVARLVDEIARLGMDDRRTVTPEVSSRRSEFTRALTVLIGR